jgi:hypothetical protein
VLDPDCVRLPLDRRARLAPIRWAELPNLRRYTDRLRELSGMDELTDTRVKEQVLAGLRALPVPLPSVSSDDDGDAAAPQFLSALLGRRRPE